MITPSFTVAQDDEYVLVDVSVAHLRQSSGVEMVVDGTLFVFALQPYYLRLRFPHALVDDERAHARFGLDGVVRVRLPKETKGQHFPDLDLAAKLLARKEPLRPLIEEMDVENSVKVGAEGEAVDWEVQQSVPEDGTAKYGFNGAYSGIVGLSVANGNDINEVMDPERATPAERLLERLLKENIKFDPEIYAADYIMAQRPEEDDKNYRELLLWRSPSARALAAWQKLKKEGVMEVAFSAEEQERMVQLPRRTVLVDGPQLPHVVAFLVSVLFAYHYDLRETEGEHNVESAWTVGKLTPQIAALDSVLAADGALLRGAVVGGYRRALCYPYHRSFDLAQKLWDDVYYTLRGGKRQVLRCLLDCRELFRYHDVYYVYDKIWMEDLCVWLVHSAGEELVRLLAHDLKREAGQVLRASISFDKPEKALALTEVEALANEAARADEVP